MSFPPIAIVGQACLLPGAADPQSLWELVAAGRDALTAVPAERWRLTAEQILADPGSDARDRTWSDRGGYVRGFEASFDPTGFALPAEEIRALDPLFQWALHVGRQALRASGHDGGLPASARARAGICMGNLSFPTDGLAGFAEQVWLTRAGARHLARTKDVAPLNRFMSGLPAQHLARALGLDGGAFALDAACASSLFALKLACDRLHDGSADLMLAGAVNRTDDLFIHVGFCALQAMSRSGRSRPFHRGADGLVPAEGAAFLVLKRLADAVSARDEILGVIRGIGLSNDGRGAGFLVPSAEGQVRAMAAAYAGSGLRPQDVSLVECHATGTPVGDATEIRSMAQLYAGARDVPIGSLKSNLGHLITAAGTAGVIKVLGAMHAQVRPPTLHVDEPLEAIASSPFRLLTAAEPWESREPRVAAVSAFGFGGNNAHLLLQQWQPERTVTPITPAPRASVEVAIVGLSVIAPGCEDAAGLARILATGRAQLCEADFGGLAGLVTHLELDAAGLRFPPRDLEVTTAQQLMMLRAAENAAGQAGPLPRERTSILCGMGCDAEIARYGARWRSASYPLAEVERAGMRDSFAPALTAAGVVGTMPNIVANRLNVQLDVAGPSYTISAEELSGMTALALAVRALSAAEIDAAVVGAVDVAAEPVHAAAARAALPADRQIPGDAAVALVLKRLADARLDGNRVYAIVGSESDGSALPQLRLGLDDGCTALTPLLGHAHAASGLLHVAAAALALHHRFAPAASESSATPLLPTASPLAAEIAVSSFGGDAARTSLRQGQNADTRALLLSAPPRIYVYAGQTLADAQRALRAATPTHEGPARIVVVARDQAERQARAERALRLLQQGPCPASGVLGQGMYVRERPVEGELAFVFTGAASVYSGMARELFLAFPEVVDRLAPGLGRMDEALAWFFDPRRAASASPFDKLWGASLISQLHAELTQRLLGLSPAAALGISSGETNALFALGAFHDMAAMFRDIEESGLYSRELAGDFAAARRAWSLPTGTPVRWQNHRIVAPLATVAAALADEPRAHLTIINTPDDCVIGGDADACARVIARIGSQRAHSLDYDLVVHCPELAAWRDSWYALHHRPVAAPPRVRFYTHATGSSYLATDQAAADALTGQALRTLDFPALVRKAHADGVRVFIEHGPQGACSRFIEQILGASADYVSVPLDLAGEPAVSQLVHAVAQLVAAGVAVDHNALLDRLSAAYGQPESRRPGSTSRAPIPLRFAVHPAAPEVPAMAVAQPLKEPTLIAIAADTVHTSPQRMLPAPQLPRILPPYAEEPSAAPPQALSPPAVPTEPYAGVPSPVLAALLAAHRDVAEVHRSYVAQQAQIHQRFLALRARIPASLPAVATRPPQPAATAPVPAKPAKVAPPPAAPSVVAPPAPEQESFPGPKLKRAQLVTFATGRISEVYGPLFAQQDGFRRQVRMPAPPLLLADRVLGIDARPGVLGKGTLWTETDVRADSWYLHDGRMPAGIMIESGQADLMLISWMGADFLNRGERVYRLLGCELTYHGGLPQPGDTLRYDIHVDGHAQHGDVRIFFFHYDCRIRGVPFLTVRQGQAGFFTDAELADSGGILWDPRTGEHTANAQVAPPVVASHRTAYTQAQVRAFAHGQLRECFGAGYAWAEPHVRTPRPPSGQLLLLGEVTQLLHDGGPWGRGYLRAVSQITPEDWFFRGHFQDDPCMPGTLMFEGCLQAMAFYLAALGFTLDKDGYRFEPVLEQTYKLRCRGQVIPSSRELVYELFVDELVGGATPTLYADLLCTVDGLPAFHCRRMGLRLVPGFPLETRREQLALPVPERPVASFEGHRFDWPALIACAWGKPSDAFGPRFAVFDGTRRTPRLPGPPYHFMTRISRIDGELFVAKPGAAVEVEYDVPADAWYFADNGARTMPFCVLLEAALQPCGWLASATGVTLAADEDLAFRNLDGTATWHREVFPSTTRVRTRSRLVSLSRSAGMIIVGFEVECSADQVPIYTMKTVFGFFPKIALASQAGLAMSEADKQALVAPSEVQIDLSTAPARFYSSTLRLGSRKLRLLDRVTGHWPTAGRAGLGRMRAEKDVDPSEWFFTAHFFQDPVQPGSLGLEAMVELLQIYMIVQDLGQGFAKPRFEPLGLEQSLTWKYRGQVLPTHKRVTIEIEVTAVTRDDRGVLAVADSYLTVDGMRIYQATNLGMRIVEGGDEATALAPPVNEPVVREELFDPASERWINDHRPTYTRPVLPMMSVADKLAQAAAHVYPQLRIVELRDLALSRWILCDAPVRLRTELQPLRDGVAEVSLAFWREAADRRLSRFEVAATAKLVLAADYPKPGPRVSPLTDAQPVESPYTNHRVFHGPAFQRLLSLRVGAAGSTSVLDASASEVPQGALAPVLLDAALHGIPHDNLEQWSPAIPLDHIGYPSVLERACFHRPSPTSGQVVCEARLVRVGDDGRDPVFHLQLSTEDQLWAELWLREVLLPKGPIGRADPTARRAFLEGHGYVPGVGLTRSDASGTRLSVPDLRASDWLPGTMARAYGTADGIADPTEIAIKEHLAHHTQTHPARVHVGPNRALASVATHPLTRYPVSARAEGDEVTVRDAGAPRLELAAARQFWQDKIAVGRWLYDDLFHAFAERFVADVSVEDPRALAALRGRGLLFLANHQVAIESPAFWTLIPALTGNVTVILAKDEHRRTWIGELMTNAFAHPGVTDPGSMIFFNRSDPAQLLQIAERLRGFLSDGISVLVHVEGTRALSCRTPVSRLSSVWLDLALATQTPIVPVRFRGGLPVSAAEQRYEFPIGFGKQTINLGTPISAESLRALSFADRSRAVLQAINALGGSPELETPHPGDPALAAAVQRRAQALGIAVEKATCIELLAQLDDPSEETRAFLAAVEKGSWPPL